MTKRLRATTVVLRVLNARLLGEEDVRKNNAQLLDAELNFVLAQCLDDFYQSFPSLWQLSLTFLAHPVVGIAPKASHHFLIIILYSGKYKLFHFLLHSALFYNIPL